MEEFADKTASGVGEAKDTVVRAEAAGEKKEVSWVWTGCLNNPYVLTDGQLTTDDEPAGITDCDSWAPDTLRS